MLFFRVLSLMSLPGFTSEALGLWHSKHRRESYEPQQIWNFLSLSPRRLDKQISVWSPCDITKNRKDDENFFTSSNKSPRHFFSGKEKRVDGIPNRNWSLDGPNPFLLRMSAHPIEVESWKVDGGWRRASISFTLKSFTRLRWVLRQGRNDGWWMDWKAKLKLIVVGGDLEKLISQTFRLREAFLRFDGLEKLGIEEFFEFFEEFWTCCWDLWEDFDLWRF